MAMTWQSERKILYVYLIETKTVQSSAFNIGIVHHFDTVNHLDTGETGHMQTPSTCSYSPASSFPGFRKAGRGPGNEATHSLYLTSLMDSTRLPFDM